MKVIQQALVSRVVNYINEITKSGRVKINGVFADYEISNVVVDGNKIRKYILLDEEIGFVEEAQLISASGEILALKPFLVNKQEDGLALVFEITVSVQEG